MTILTPAARLKVKGDTFFIPVPNDGVYFRNNVGTFRMEGEMIDRWIEKLIPMFNGEHTLADLTDGLSNPYRDRVYEIADTLHQKGFIRDVSQDRPHQLSNGIIQKYAAQIAFLDSFGDSGAYRFQCYRQAGVLAIGSGPFFVSLISALLESGLPKIRMLITDSVPTNRQRLAELADQARRTDPEVLLDEIALQKEGARGWRDVVQPFQSILYVSQEGDVEELRLLHAICKAEKKVFLPAMCLHQTGIAGPVVHPESEGCWESAWRRLHQSAVYKDPEQHVFSSTAGAMLANVIVFELFKTVTGELEQRNSLFLLDLETLEGDWHPFMPHPMIRGYSAAERVQVSNTWMEGSSDKSVSNRLLPYFNRLTSAQTGILHIWEEGDLRQLPLSQCRVQAVDPLSEGPARLLQDLICTGLTHEEARREAGLTGIEAYVSRLAGVLVQTKEIVGIGVGETAAEGVIRGLQANLTEQLALQQKVRKQPVIRVQLSKVEDEECRFYLQALTAMRGTPMIALGEKVSGFPVVWIGTGDSWYGSVGLNMTMAFQKVLKAALLKVQNHIECRAAQVLEASSVQLGKEVAVDLVIPSSEGTVQPKVLREALQILKKNGKQLFVLDLAVEPFLKEELEGVFGVSLREEVSR
ncbi:putative thiazole-containing bacteriocin maturation protein [Paenibacillus sp. MBLB4367]|uniref:putative thiazole-containing bacteriocin maturation protein n=1 Tax=Paenibacillus sp. MBLB4367 TaxID=3384767 RepID=UPI0039083AA0